MADHSMGVAGRTLAIQDARGRSRSVPSSVLFHRLPPDVPRRAPGGFGAAGGRPPCAFKELD
eukprot:285532-Pleurochrysis_carterae.AAC.1